MEDDPIEEIRNELAFTYSTLHGNTIKESASLEAAFVKGWNSLAVFISKNSDNKELLKLMIENCDEWTTNKPVLSSGDNPSN